MSLFWWCCVMVLCCKEVLSSCDIAEDSIFECTHWDDVERLTDKSLVKHLVMANQTGPLSCDSGTFKSLSNLEVIAITKGLLQTIRWDCFEGLPALKFVQLRHHKLVSVAFECFNGTSVERLWLDGNGLVNVDLNGIVMPKLGSLSLSGNKLKSIEIDSSSLPELRILDLSSNNIDRLRVASESLSFVKLDQNRISTLFADQVQGPFIRMLYASENEIKALNATAMFTHLPRLEFVHLDKNPIVEVNFTYFNVSTILFTDRTIKVTRTGDASPAMAIDVTWSTIRALDVSFNRLDRMTIFNLTAGVGVQLLRLSHNRILEIKRNDLLNLPDLLLLDASNNKILVIEDGALDHLTDLHTLILAHNCLHGVSATIFNNLISIVNINLSNNILTYFRMPGTWSESTQRVSLTEYHPFLNARQVLLSNTVIRCSCYEVLQQWTRQFQRTGNFIVDGDYQCLVSNATCLNSPLKDQTRIDEPFAYCKVIIEEEDVFSDELQEFEDFF